MYNVFHGVSLFDFATVLVCIAIIFMFITVGCVCSLSEDNFTKRKWIVCKIVGFVYILVCCCLISVYTYVQATEVTTDITEGFDICAYMRVEEVTDSKKGSTALVYKVTYNDNVYEVKATSAVVGDSTVLHITNMDSDSPIVELTISQDVKDTIQLQSQTIRIGE